MKKTINLCAIFALTLGLSVFASAQETTTTTITKQEVVKNLDGSYSVIEYPVGKEITVELTPNNIQGAKGWAKVMRTNDGTTVALDLSGLPADSKNYYVYAVDNSGKVSLLGPAAVEGGISKTTFTTPMNQFMLVLSPNEGITAYDTNTPVVFRSSVPTGHAVVPVVRQDSENLKAATTEVASTYQVPLLRVPGFKVGDTTEMDIKFTGELEGLKGKAYVNPRADGATQIKMRFDDMKMAPKQKRFVLWASAPDGTYTKLGQVVNTGERQEGEIRSETALKDFGLFVTMEEEDVTAPTSKVYSVFRVN